MSDARPNEASAASGATETRLSADTPLPASCVEAIEHLRAAIAGGEAWPEPMLRAMGLWTLAEEIRKGRHYRYLVQDEAFDWALLAHRLAEEVGGLIPAHDRKRTLRNGRFLQEIPQDQVRSLLGPVKYGAYLNYWYGVIVEAALQGVVRKEAVKEKVSRGLSARSPVTDDVFRRLYGDARTELLAQFRADRPSAGAHETDSEGKAFTYWLFRLRLKQSEPARIASDTRKALESLANTTSAAMPPPAAERESRKSIGRASGENLGTFTDQWRVTPK